MNIEFESIPKPSDDHWLICWVETGDLAPSSARKRLEETKEVVTEMLRNAHGEKRQKVMYAAMVHGKKTMEFEAVGADEYVLWRLSRDD